MLTTNTLEKTVLVLFGGQSSEHEISLRSAVYVLQNIPAQYQIIPVGISRTGVFRSLSGTYSSSHFAHITTTDLADIVAGDVPQSFPSSQNLVSTVLPFSLSTIQAHYQLKGVRILNLEAECVFPVLHGPNGEDGRMQALFELANMAYVGCDLRSTVVGIDKHLQKRLAREAGIPVARYDVVDQEEFALHPKQVLDRIEKKIGFPCFAKPNAQGSAIGANKAKNREELQKALQEALSFDPRALVEELLIGTEVECAFLGNGFAPRVTCAGEIVAQDFYSYEEKYAADSPAQQYIPARLSPERMQELKEQAKRVAQVTGIEGFSRIDFWNIPKTNQFIFNEINTIPGLTSISMFPKLWEYEGVPGKTWIAELLNAAQARKQNMTKLSIENRSKIS